MRAATRQLQAEVWVVDNASTDGSVAALQPLFPEVHWIASATNDGFARANNRALAKATGRWVLFLNPDTLLPEDCLEKCLSFAAAQPDAGAMGVRMLDGSGQYLPESKRGFPGLWASACKLLGLTALFPQSRLFARYYMGHLPADKSHPVEVLAGAFMLVRSELLRHTGGFDERFFMYGEDIDLSYRLHGLVLPQQPHVQWRNYYVAHAPIIHFKGESSRKGSFANTKLFYKAMAQFVKKHFSGLWIPGFIALIYLAIGLRGMLSVIAAPLLAVGEALKNNERRETSQPDVLYVAGNAADKEAVQRIAQGSQLQVENWQESAGEKSTAMRTLPPQLVWCISSDQPLSRAFDLLTKGAATRWWWHYRGSQSMVSSHSSRRAGTTLTAMDGGPTKSANT